MTNIFTQSHPSGSIKRSLFAISVTLITLLISGSVKAQCYGSGWSSDLGHIGAPTCNVQTKSVASTGYSYWTATSGQQYTFTATPGTGCFTSYKMYRVVEADQTDGITYAIQYFANAMSDYFTYQNEFAKDLQKEVTATWVLI